MAGHRTMGAWAVYRNQSTVQWLGSGDARGGAEIAPPGTGDDLVEKSVARSTPMRQLVATGNLEKPQAAWGLVLAWLLRVVDHVDFHRSLQRFQLQPQLFFQRGEDRGTVQIRSRRNLILGNAGREFGGIVQLEIVEIAEARFVDHRPIQKPRENPTKVAHGDPGAGAFAEP